MTSETYRGLTCHYMNPFFPVIDWDWIATDPNGEGEMLAHAATLDELKAEIDALLEDE
jgi:hypothetical protein